MLTLKTALFETVNVSVKDLQDVANYLDIELSGESYAIISLGFASYKEYIASEIIEYEEEEGISAYDVMTLIDWIN